MPHRTALTESGAMLEYWRLQTSPVFRGVGVAKGDGRTVLALPGLFGNDMYLRPLRSWLGRIGYTPRMSMIPVNAGCPKRLLADAERWLLPHVQRTSGPIAIIGHSRGGLLGKALASRLGERVSHFITLGSPVGSMLRMGKAGLASLNQASSSGASMANPTVVEAGRAAMRLFDPDCESPLCGCEYIDDLLAPLPEKVRITAIYSTEDAIVPAAACPIDGAVNIAIQGTHSGLVFNTDAFTQIAKALND